MTTKIKMKLGEKIAWVGAICAPLLVAILGLNSALVEGTLPKSVVIIIGVVVGILIIHKFNVLKFFEVLSKKLHQQKRTNFCVAFIILYSG